jgi:hypothetical protein
MRSPGGVRLGEQRPRWSKLPPGAVSSAGAEAVELAALAGLDLDDWQSWWLDHALAERADGFWAAKESVLITGRQSGKNGALAALELFGLVVLEEPLIIHSAHEVPTALNHFQFMQQLFEASPDLDRMVRAVKRTNGREAIVMKSGATLRFRARMTNSGRGLTGTRVVMDEAFDIRPAAMGALLPTMRAVANSHITYASSAPKSNSVVLHSLIRRGRGDDGDDRLFYAEWGNPPGTELDDEAAWAWANPALGIVKGERCVTVEALRDEFRTLVAGGDPELIAEFAREAVGIGEEPVGSARESKLPQEAWAATVGPDRVAEPGRMTLAYGVSKDGEWATIVAGSGSMADPYVDVVEHRQGTGWLPGRLVELVERWRPVAVGCNGAGQAGAMVGPVLAAFQAAGVDSNLLRQMGATEYKQACGGFFLDVVEGRLRRPAGQGPLDLAGEDATERPLGDAWAWDVRNATVPISPLEAATIARALLPAELREYDPLASVL